MAKQMAKIPATYFHDYRLRELGANAEALYCRSIALSKSQQDSVYFHRNQIPFLAIGLSNITAAVHGLLTMRTHNSEPLWTEDEYEIIYITDLKSEMRSPKQEKSNGCVYIYDTHFIYNGAKVYKIGITTNLQNRLESLGAANPFGHLLIAAVLPTESRKYETKLHKELAELRVSRETYAIPYDVLTGTIYAIVNKCLKYKYQDCKSWIDNT